LKPVQGRVQRTVFHLEDVVRSSFNAVCDGMCVTGSKHKRLKDQHVEGAQQHVAFGLGVGWHGSPHCTPYEYLVERSEMRSALLGLAELVRGVQSGRRPLVYRIKRCSSRTVFQLRIVMQL